MHTAAPSLDTWTTLFLLAAGQGLFLSLLLWQRRRNTPDRSPWLPALIFTFSLLLVFNVGFWTRYDWYFPPVQLIYPAGAFLIGPFLLFYLDDLAARPVFRSFRWLHFLPALLVLGLRLPAYLRPLGELQAQMEETQHIVTPLHQLGLSWLGAPWFITFHLVLYLALVLWYGRALLSHNPAMTGTDLPASRIRLLMWLYALYTVAFVSYFVLVRMAFFRIEHDYLISWVMAVAVYSIGYWEYHNAIVIPHQHKATDLPKYQSSSLTGRAISSIADSLENLMEKERAYRENELRLSDLAEKLSVTPHHLSQVINDHYGKTFNQFVNDYRIREAIELLTLAENRDLHIIEIAWQVGFNNKTTFNQAFKQHTGMPPSHWRNIHAAGAASRLQ